MLGSSLQMKYTVFPVYLHLRQISTNSAQYMLGSGGNTMQKICIFSISMCGTLCAKSVQTGHMLGLSGNTVQKFSMFSISMCSTVCAKSVQTVQMEQYFADVGFPCAPNWYVHGTWCTWHMVHMEQHFEGEILHFQWISIEAPHQWTQSTWIPGPGRAVYKLLHSANWSVAVQTLVSLISDHLGSVDVQMFKSHGISGSSGSCSSFRVMGAWETLLVHQNLCGASLWIAAPLQRHPTCGVPKSASSEWCFC